MHNRCIGSIYRQIRRPRHCLRPIVRMSVNGASTERQRFFTSHLGWIMFGLVAYIHLSDIGCHYWEKLQQHAPWCILRMSVNGASATVCYASWVIYVPNGCRHPFIKYWQPLLATTTATCSLLHPEKVRQRSVNSFGCCIIGNQGIARIFAFIMELLPTQLGNNAMYQR